MSSMVSVADVKEAAATIVQMMAERIMMADITLISDVISCVGIANVKLCRCRR